ncbi:hypothetical protein MMC12_004975 [Toensbergia leucococca]|nr:hypothetical protein [Toensbergia leucococca]
MASPPYQPPDLSSVLRTLAAYTQPLPPTPSNPPPTDLEEGEYDPSTLILDLPPAPAPQPNLLPPPPLSKPSTPLPNPTRHATPLPPPKPITTFPPALRHTLRLLSQNPHLLPRLKALISTHHTHERQWWAGRLALLQKQRDRVESKRKLDDVLKAVGGLINPITHEAPPSTTPTTNPELALYDSKVHRACTDMVRATSTELREMGIPFFGAREELGGGVGEEEFAKLRGKMLGFLEELCQE